MRPPDEVRVHRRPIDALYTEAMLLADEAREPSRRLGPAPAADPALRADLPHAATALVVASTDLHRRVSRLDAAMESDAPPPSPARTIQDRLALVF